MWPDMKIDQLRLVNFVKLVFVLLCQELCIWTRFSFKVLKKINISSPSVPI